MSASASYDFAAPTPWSTVTRGPERVQCGNQTLFVFTSPAKAIALAQETVSRRGQPRRKRKGQLRVMTRARAQQQELAPELVSAAFVAAANLAKLVEADKEDYVCCVCMDRPVQVRFEPCNHIALCRTCTARLDQHSLHARRCPLCRASVKHVVDLTSGKRINEVEPYGTFKRAGEDVLANRRLFTARARAETSRTRRAASTRQRAQGEAGGPAQGREEE